jgi:hypothetical protein
MSDDIDTKNRHTSGNGEQEPQKFRADLLTDEQLAMLASTWDSVKQSDTPMTDLRAAMGSSDLFSGLHDVNNLELRTLATSAHATLESRHAEPGRADELRAILGAVAGKATYMDKRSALSDLLGFDVAHHMTNTDIDAFIRDAETELTSLEVVASTTDTEDHDDEPSKPNRDLANQVSDLLDGQLAVSSADRVHYGAGATALGKKVGGQYAPGSQLRDIAANADQIRDGLADRGTPDDADDSVDTSSVSSADTSGRGSSPDTAPSPLDTSTPTPLAPDTTPVTSVPVPNSAPTTPDQAPASSDRSPTPDQHEPLVLSFIDQTYDAITAARDAAEARRRNELQQGGRVKRFLRNMWKGENGIAGAYYLEKYKREALAQIEEEGDVLAHESSDLVARERARVATIERMQMEFDLDAGEKHEELVGDSEFSLAAKDLLRRYVSGNIADPEALTEECNRLFERLAEAGNKELIGEGRVRINNLIAIGDQIKAMDDHEAALDRLKIYTGESRSDVRSEAKLNKTERVIERLQQSKYTAWISPETISTAAAVALGIARIGRGTVLRAAGVTLVPGVLGGAFAGARESTRIRQERALHAREMAQGKRHEGGERRSELDDALYEMVDATSLTAQLESLLGEGSSPTPEEIQSAYEAIAMVDARRSVSNKQDIDFIRYSEPVKIREERRDLVKALGAAKTRLAQYVGDLPQGFRDQFNIAAGQSADEALRGYTNAVTELDADISSKDAAFHKIHRRRVRNAVVVGTLTSAFIGLGAQEALAFASPSYDGLAEHLVHGGSPSEHGRQTTLEGVREAIFGHDSDAHVDRVAPSKTYDLHALGNHPNALELPSNYHLVTASNGTMTIEGPKGFTPIEGLTLDKDGSFSSESLAQLKEHHVSAIDTGGMVAGEDKIVSQNMSVEQYNTLHSAHTTHVTRDFPYDSNTEMPDNNEKRLWWAGEGDKGLGKDGSTIQMSVSHMTAEGSFHGSNHISWAQAAHDGKLKLAVSASRDTQAHVYFVDVKPNGAIDIPKDNPSSKFFSVGKDGQVEFNGAYAEVVEVRDKVGDVTHIAPLATEVGSDSLTTIPDKISVPTQHYAPHVKLTPPVITHEAQGRVVEGFFGPSIVPRRPLEKIKREAMGGGYGSAYSFERNFEEKWLAERSPRLNNNPNANLDTGRELKWYKKQQEKARGKEYIAELDKYIDANEDLRSMGNETKAIVCIPVAGANESENIYRTLSMFGRQDVESQKASVILLNVNWKESLEGDPTEKAKIEKTLAEIERAKRDFPDLRVATFEKVWTDEFVQEKRGKIYGEVIKVLYDTAALAMERGVAEGRRDSDAEALLITNDADTEGMSYKYLKNYIKSMEANPEQDTFTATIRRGVSAYKDYPGYAMVSNFYANTSMSMLHHQARGEGGASTDGPNSAFRMSLYAAMGGVEDEIGGGADGALAHRAWLARFGEKKPSKWQKLHRKKEPVATNRVLGKFVSGASVDTMPDRLLGAYRQGKWIASGWDGFDNGGYESREAVAAAGTVGPENPETDIDDIAKRIEVSISAFGSRWWRMPSAISTSLRTTFGPNKEGHELYEYTWDFSKPGDGGFVFNFTEEGKKELQKRMLYDRKGNRVDIGDRMQHYLYDKMKDEGPVLLQ